MTDFVVSSNFGSQLDTARTRGGCGRERGDAILTSYFEAKTDCVVSSNFGTRLDPGMARTRGGCGRDRGDAISTNNLFILGNIF